MTSRARIRRGRAVHYYPTSAEETSNGAGPWPGMITDVNTDGSVDLLVDPPTPTAVPAAAVEADADATYGQPEADLINELKGIVNDLRAIANERIKASVVQGDLPGQYSLVAGSDAV